MELDLRDIVISKNITKCASYDIPSIPEYLSATNKYGITIVSVGTLALVTVLVIVIDTLRYVMKNSSPTVKAHTAFVIGVYPVTSLVTYFAILVPRAHLLAEAITQGMFMAGMYQLFCLFMAYCGGDAELVKKVKPKMLNLKVGPCCCWPCCFFLPSYDVNKKTLKRLRLLVLQLPVVQGLVYLILLVMWAERESLYQVNYMYLQPVIILSILFGIWGMAMTINILKDTLSHEYVLIGKFLVLQMVLIFAKLQGLITRSLVWFHLLPCNPPITPQVYANLIHNTLMLTEMILLSASARYLYKKILPKSESQLRISTVGRIMASNNNNNNNNNINIASLNDRNKCCDNDNKVNNKESTNYTVDVVEKGYDNFGNDIQI